MATIKEDYVSFETAKLLKEKGFDESTSMVYMSYGDLCKLHRYDSIRNSNYNDITKEYYEYTAPTLQMATKWLREVHNLNVEVYRTACGYIGCIVSIPSGTDIKFLEDDGDDKASGTYTKSEYAFDAAIKYCLENLIK